MGLGDLQESSLAKLFMLSEFGIGIGEVIPHSFKHYNENSSESSSFYQQLCWEHLPPEENFTLETDDWGFPGTLYQPKRDLFIANADLIESAYGELVGELSYLFGGAFYQLNNKAETVAVLDINEVTTCLRYWK